MTKPEDRKADSSDFQFDKLLSGRFSALSGCLNDDARGGGYALYCRYKTGNYWQLVVKRAEPGTAALQVAFGRGGSLGSALKDLNAAVARGDWKEDRPYSAG